MQEQFEYQFNHICQYSPSIPVKNIVVTCFMEFKNQILVLQRARFGEQLGLWGIPGGKLKKNENPREGLVREIFEETTVATSSKSFYFLDKVNSMTSEDGSYLLYLYYLKLLHKPLIALKPKEHFTYKWVSLNNFKKLKLLFAQGEAFDWVADKLRERLGGF